jgi:hypothetical protein
MATLDEIMAGYLADRGPWPPEGKETLTPVIVRARRVKVSPKGGGIRMVMTGRDATADDLAELNAASWSPVTEIPAVDDFTHLAQSGDEFWLVSIRWEPVSG